MNKALEYIFLFLVFPGLLFSAAMGMIIGWIDRKVTARIQWRVGPPWYQNFADVAKLLFCKETLIPQGASRGTFFLMPLLALTGATLASTILVMVNISPKTGFIGDLIVVVYLLMMPAIALMLGAFASDNALASLGGSREMKLMLGYELPFIIALIVPVMKSGYEIKLGEMISSQSVHPVIASLSGAISFFVMLICVQAKAGFAPFDIAEAETEIASGVCIEYSGKALGILKTARYILNFAAPMLLITLYFGGVKPDIEGVLKGALNYLFILVAMIVIKNTNPRVRIDQAVRFFWGPVTGLSIIAVLLACLGR